MQRAKADFHELARKGELPAASVEAIAASQAEDVRVRASLAFNKLSCGTMRLLTHAQLQALVAIASAPVVLPPREALSLLDDLVGCGTAGLAKVRARLAQLTRIPEEARRAAAATAAAAAAAQVPASPDATALAPSGAHPIAAEEKGSVGAEVANLSAHEMEERAAAAAAAFGASQGSDAPGARSSDVTVPGTTEQAGTSKSARPDVPKKAASGANVLPARSAVLRALLCGTTLLT